MCTLPKKKKQNQCISYSLVRPYMLERGSQKPEHAQSCSHIGGGGGSERVDREGLGHVLSMTENKHRILNSRAPCSDLSGILKFEWEGGYKKIRLVAQ